MKRLKVLLFLKFVTSAKFQGDPATLTCNGDEIFGLLTTKTKSHPKTKIKGIDKMKTNC